MGPHGHSGSVDVLIRLDEVVRNKGPEQLGRVHWMLFGHDIDGILHRISRDNNAIVSLRVSEMSYFSIVL